jgi:hypothetical protein
MRKPLIIAVAGAIALATAAVAMAAVFTASGITKTTAAFTADKVTNVRAHTCTGADNKAFTITSGRYTGTADFTNPALELDGPLTMDARTTYSTSDSLGYVEGSFRIKDDDTRVSGRFSATLDGTKLVGFLTGASRGNHARILGNLSATFVPTTGLTGGALGSTSTGPALAVLAGPVCKGKPRPEPPKPAPKPRSFSVHGKVAAIGTSPASITVTARGPITATCFTDGTSPALTGFAVNDKVEMKCEGVATTNNNVTTTTWTLRALKKDH